MKVIYKNTELQHNTKNYTELVNKPSLDGTVLQGNISLDTLSLYDKPKVQKLVDAVSQIRLVASMPADPEANMTYYVGPDERGLYDVILVDDSKTQINMGTTQFGQYKSGAGVNVAADNTININTDDVSVYIDSEGKIASSLDGNALPPFVGATASTAGTKGVVPKPLANSGYQVLRGDSTWVNINDIIHPIGNIYIAYNNTINPNTLFPGQTWEKLEAGYLLRVTSDGGLGHPTVGVPNIVGRITWRPVFNLSTTSANLTLKGAFTLNTFGIESGGYHPSSGAPAQLYDGDVVFNAANTSTEAGNIYQNFDTVQAPSIDVVVWRRTA